jgi:hypothetical protein
MIHVGGLRALAIPLLLASGLARTQEIGGDAGPRLRHAGEARRREHGDGDRVQLRTPEEGPWSIATGWDGQWPSGWWHGRPERIAQEGPWLLLAGKVEVPDGVWEVEDAYRPTSGLIEGRRRWTWRGPAVAAPTTLSVRWLAPATDAQVLLPGICYHGNPSGVRTGRGVVAAFAGRPGERAVFEEHRYPMPFASLEWRDGTSWSGAALHTIPSPAPFARVRDLWWSLGVVARDEGAEVLALSGPVAINGQTGVVKANQGRVLPYPNAWLEVPPGGVIEKRFFVEAYPVARQGDGFRTPLAHALAIHRPTATAGLPTVAGILEAKLRFAASRWFEDGSCSGYRMYPHADELVMGWCGQADSAGYAMLVLGARLGREDLVDRGRRSLDFLATTPVDAGGFGVRYRPGERSWSQRDPLSQGQAMGSFARAIAYGRPRPELDTAAWERFLRQACDAHAERILTADWRPESTHEGFLVMPLCRAAGLFGVERYAAAAGKAARHYVERHRSLREPYWGGTLDASCEDKEGAWAAFQAFLAMHELEGGQDWLEHAAHAMDLALTYTYVWDVDLPPGRLRDHGLATRGWTTVSAQNMHLDVFGVVYTPEIRRMGELLGRPELGELAEVMYRTCGQMIDPRGSQGEQLQQTNFAQHGDLDDLARMRGGYAESWTVFWMTAHFLHAAAVLEEAGALEDWMR